MAHPLRSLVPLALVAPLTCIGLGACGSPWDIPWDPLPWDTEGSASTGMSTGESETSETTATTATPGTTAGQDMTEGTASSGDPEDPTVTGGDEATGDAAPPEILDLDLAPQPMLDQGPIALEVLTAAADGVLLRLEDGSEFALEADPEGLGIFHGEIAALGAQKNGTHQATLIPWAEEAVGQAFDFPYTIDLLAPGSELLWDVGDLIGGGEVVALGHASDGRVLELGTLTNGGKTRCYLRRRNTTGAWKASDVQDLLPGVECNATDLAVGPTGEILVLAQRETQHGLRWWLGELSAWGAIPKNRGLGALGEEATALAQHSSGMAAVCGSTPTQKNDGFDAAAWLLKPKVPGASWFFDYEAEGNDPHKFAELPRDCAFAGDTLVMVGEALGDHDNKGVQHNRLLLLEFDTQAKVAAWTVAGGDLDPQSYGTAVTVDDQGRYYIGGYVCGATCNQPIAELRAYAPGGNLLWRSPISAIPNPHWAPHDLAWSPAGYAVVALGGTKGQEFAFTVRAYTIEQLDPLWTYSRQDNAFLHLARAVSVGRYGQIAAGGLGMTGYPAVAYIGG